MIRGLGGKIPSAYSQTLNGQYGFKWNFYFFNDEISKEVE